MLDRQWKRGSTTSFQPFSNSEGLVKEPVDHILRPQLPWRDNAAITECGMDAAKAPTLTRNQYLARLKEMGQQRTAILTCMTCAQTANNWGTWEDDPRQALMREIQWENPYGYRRNNERGWKLHDELWAAASIIAEHRTVFDALVEERARRRDWLSQKAEHERSKVQKTVTQLKPRL
jgi:hypothetical protein